MPQLFSTILATAATGARTQPAESVSSFPTPALVRFPGSLPRELPLELRGGEEAERLLCPGVLHPTRAMLDAEADVMASSSWSSTLI